VVNGDTHKLEICLQTPHNDPYFFRRHQSAPLIAMRRVEKRKTCDPVYTRRLGKAVVVDIVDVPLLGPAISQH
jgi:hypothetical protein